EPLPGDAASAGDVLEERHDVVMALGPAEGEHQERLAASGRRRFRRRLGAAVVPDGEGRVLVGTLTCGRDVDGGAGHGCSSSSGRRRMHLTRRRRGSMTVHTPTAWNPPSTCTISPVVAGNQSE